MTVAQEVADVLRHSYGINVVEVSGANSENSQFVKTDGPLRASSLTDVLEETGCAVTAIEKRGDNYIAWFGRVEVGIDGPIFERCRQ